MKTVTMKISIGVLLWAPLCGLRSSPAQTSPGLEALPPSVAHQDAAPVAAAQPGAPADQLTLDPDALHKGVAQAAEAPLYLCACGCGIFEVGTSSMLPQGPGGTVFLEYDYQDQNRNWHGASSAPAANNADKAIRTSFLLAGLQYMVSSSWGFQVEIPYDFRHFQTTGGASGNDNVSVDWGSVGDIRMQGIYTGFFPDLSAGVTFGVKLPTGSFKHNDDYGDIDRDTELGTGSTDVLLGGFYRHALTADNSWTWFVQLNSDLPVFTQDGYRPGIELDTAAGIYYNGFSIGKLNITPVVQILTSARSSDSGPNAAHPCASGYERILLSPGLELHYHPFMLYTDVEVPVFQDFTGDQLVAPVLFKVMFGFNF